MSQDMFSPRTKQSKSESLLNITNSQIVIKMKEKAPADKIRNDMISVTSGEQGGTHFFSRRKSSGFCILSAIVNVPGTDLVWLSQKRRHFLQELNNTKK